MKSKKTSHIIIGILILAGVIASVSYSFQLNNDLKKIRQPDNKVWLLGKGSYFLDTIQYEYNHLVTDFPLLELHPRVENIVEIEGYENSKKFLTINHREDTLFVTQTFPDSDTVLVAVEGDYPIVVRAGAARLQSITINQGGRIDIPVNPYGSNPGNEIVYKPEDWEKYVLRSDSFDLYLNGNGYSELFMEIENLNIHINNPYITTRTRFNCSSLIGEVGTLKILHPQGNVCLDGRFLEAKNLIVKSNPDNSAFDNGFIELKCNDYLEANLLHRMNVAYTGNPRIKKRERAFGRVVNRN